MSRRRAAQKLRDANAAGVASMIRDAEKALGDLDRVRTATIAEDRTQIIDEALNTYDSILQRVPSFAISAPQLIALDERISALRERLIEAKRIKVKHRVAG